MLEKLIKEAYTWLGTPHKNYAKVKGVGVDCGMLLIGALEGAGLVEKNLNKNTPSTNEWHLHHSEEWFKNYMEKYCEEVSADDMQAGDFLLYQFGRCCSHGAIYVGDNLVIHSMVLQGVIISPIDDILFFDAKGHNRLRHVYRWRGGN